MRNPSLTAGLALLALLAGAALFAPWLTPYDPLAADLGARLLPPGPGHPLGTDALGRDVLARVLHGARLTLGAAAAVAAVSLALGTLVGVVAGYAGGWADDLLMRLVDLWKAFPGRVLALALVGVLGPGLANVCLALVLTTWVAPARIARSLTLAVREQEYVLAARACGRSPAGIVRHHILPAVLPQMAVVAALEAGWTLMALAGLSLLGLGPQPPAPEWGAMIGDARAYFRSHPHLLFAPGAAVMLALAAFTLLGEGFRDARDPASAPAPLQQVPGQEEEGARQEDEEDHGPPQAGGDGTLEEEVAQQAHRG